VIDKVVRQSLPVEVSEGDNFFLIMDIVLGLEITIDLGNTHP
jgi:hypothetical protein